MPKLKTKLLNKTEGLIQFDYAWSNIKDLSTKFLQNQDHYFSNNYQEAEVRKDFIDKFFKALGWDVDHEHQHDPYRQEVKIEKSEKKYKGRADYSFSLAPYFNRIRFFVEAKRPLQSIITPENCFQVIRYSWPKGLPIAVLTDFYHFHIIDTRFRPKKLDATSIRIIKSWNCTDYLYKDKFAELYWLISREAVASGSIENFEQHYLPPLKSAIKQYSLLPPETKEFDEEFLQTMDKWREDLAIAFKKANKKLDSEQLTEAVQRTLDRLIFIRFLEDKGIEPDSIISTFGQKKRTIWQDFVETCRRLNPFYNGIVFKEHPIIDNKEFNPSESVISSILDDMSSDETPYNFDSIPVEILGRIYERFLGKVVLSKTNSVEVVEKENVRKAGGVYYTPDYIVSYMVDQSLSRLVSEKSLNDIMKLRIIDTACGSGSFLIGVFDYLLKTITVLLRNNQKLAKKGEIEDKDGEMHLTLSFKRLILTQCIYGLDIDPQAVEVAQLSLYLKLMENETTFTAKHQYESGLALLPPLNKNIINGNSLLTIEADKIDLFDDTQKRSLNFSDSFPEVFASGGFDLLIGNPPYIKEYTYREAFNYLHESPYYIGKMDIWYMFACRGIDLIKNESGILAYIATNNWGTNDGATILREKLIKETQIRSLIDFGDYKVFRDAGIQTMILITQKCTTNHTYKFDYRRLIGKKRILADAMTLLERKLSKSCHYLTPTINRSMRPGSILTFSENNISEILDHVENISNFRLKKSEIAQGIVAPQDFVNISSCKKLGNHFKVNEGIFVLTNSEIAKYKFSKKEKSLLKPYYTTQELGKYYGDTKNKLWIIYTDSSYTNKNSLNEYPKLKQHLDKFQSVITSTYKPYGLHRSRDENFFKGTKILAVRKCVEPTFTFTDFDCYVSQTFNVIKTNRVNLLYLTGLLNSNLIKFWLIHRGKMQGLNFQIDSAPLLRIPLINVTKDDQKRIADLVSKIIDCKSKIKHSLTDNVKNETQRICDQLERKLNEVVYEHYKLSKEDISVVNME